MDLSKMTDAQIMAGLAQTTDPDVMAIHSNESGGASNARADIVNPTSGARGSMQTMPKTAGDPGFGVKPSDGTPQDDARLGTEYYQALRKKYNDPTIAAVAYNWGPGKTDSWLANGADMSKVPNETLKYALNFNAKSSKTIPPAPQADPVATAPTLAPGETDVTGQPAPPVDTQPGWQVPDTGVLGRLMMGAGDFIRPAVRGIVRGAEAIAPAGSDFERAAHEAVGQMDATTASQDAKFKAAQQAAGQDTSGTDWVRVGGSLIPAFLLPGGAATTGGKIALGAAQGAMLGAAATKDDQSYGQNALLGAATGGAGAGITSAAGRVIRGATLRPEAQAMLDAGVTMTPGQALGGAVNRFEEKATSIPGMGDAIMAGRKAATQDMNRSLYKAVTDEVPGMSAPTDVARSSVDKIGNDLSDRYNTLLPKLSMRADQQFGNDMGQLLPQFGKLPADMRETFNSILDDNILTQTSNHGVLNGTDLKAAESAIGQEASRYGRSPAPNDQRMAQLLRSTQGVLRNTLERQNPDHAGELQPINRAFANFAILRNAADRVNNPEMPIMPGQLQAAVKSESKNWGTKGAFGRGTARLQDLSDPAMAVLGDKYPNSGTAGRLGVGAVLSGGIGMLSPATLGGMIATSGLYGTQTGRAAMLAMIARRPDLARQFGATLQGAAAPIGAATGAAAVRGQ